MPNKILDEIKQSRPFANLQQEAFLNIVRTSDALVRSSDNLLRRYDLTFTQYNVLRILRGAGETGISCSEIGKRMITAEPDVTRLLDRMEKRHWIRRRRDKRDRRYVTTWLTEDGNLLLQALDEPVRQLSIAHFEPLDERELGQLIATLEKARDGLEQRAEELG